MRNAASVNDETSSNIPSNESNNGHESPHPTGRGGRLHRGHTESDNGGVNDRDMMRSIQRHEPDRPPSRHREQNSYGDYTIPSRGRYSETV